MTNVNEDTRQIALTPREELTESGRALISFSVHENNNYQDNINNESHNSYDSANGNSCLPFLTNDNSGGIRDEGTDLAVPDTFNPRPDRVYAGNTEVPEQKPLSQILTSPEPVEGHQLPDLRLWADDKDRNEGSEGEVSVSNTAPSSEWPEERVGRMILFGVPIVTLYVDGQERLCLAQISTALLHDFSYNEIHNRRVALGITCLQCTPSQLEVLRRTGAMPVTSRRCGLITKREAERLVRSFIADVPPPRLPDNFTFKVRHQCGWGNEGVFVPARYNSSRAKCIRCSFCDAYFSPNKFIFHCHPTASDTYRHPDAANFNSWRRHLELVHDGSDERLLHAWEDVKAMFNGGSRKRFSISSSSFSPSTSGPSSSFSSYGQPSLALGTVFRDKSSSISSNSSSHSLTSSGSWQSSRGRTSTEVQNWRKIPTTTCTGMSQQITSFPPGSVGPISLLPPSLAANTHPAFFTNGLHGPMPMSYGDFLRSMSRPYNISNSPLNGNSNVLPEFYRTQPSNLLPGMLGASPYPLSYFGYPTYFPTPVPHGKGGNSVPLQNQLSSLPRFSVETGTKKMNDQDKDLDVFNIDNVSPSQEISVSEDTQDEISVDEDDTKKEATRDDSPQNNEILKDFPLMSSYSQKIPSPKDESSVCKQAEDILFVNTDEEKENDKVQEPSHEEERGQPDDNDNGVINNGKRNDETDVKLEPGHVNVVDDSCDQEQKLKASCLPHDPKSLLAIFEATEDVDTFVHLPLDTLRKLYKASKQKSVATDREHRKLKEIQRLQRMRAEELREELSRQFFAIKETIWSEIEQERKMRTALQDRLAEAQKLKPQNYNLFSNLK